MSPGIVVTDITENCAVLQTTDASGNEEITGVEIRLYMTHTFVSDLMTLSYNTFTETNGIGNLTMSQYIGGGSDNFGISETNPMIYKDSGAPVSTYISPGVSTAYAPEQ